MRLIHWRWTTLFLTLLLGLLSTVCVAQVLIPARDPGRSILMTGFAVSHPGQLTDINDIALGFPRELARRLERDQQFYVRMTPELLSYDWVLTPPTTKMLAQVAATYDSRYVISGDIIGAGIHTVPSMFGLWEKKYREIDVEISIYDARAGMLIDKFKFTGAAAGDVVVGKDRSFDGEAFRVTPFGKAIDTLIEQAGNTIRTRLITRP
ncbi:flagella assembly protein FlgT middle domain-containing protein [Undibacterium sp. RuRC25W]|uniref:flagella assembly protein FlgT middle domain-containing protein n=1 Tax=Undibacterium sp. RuRC25W TaxID=3413047 RepID=UPI003BF17671